jgi:hypothetical protein
VVLQWCYSGCVATSRGSGTEPKHHSHYHYNHHFTSRTITVTLNDHNCYSPTPDRYYVEMSGKEGRESVETLHTAVTQANIHAYTYPHTHAHVYAHTRTHTHTHTHTHAQALIKHFLQPEINGLVAPSSS